MKERAERVAEELGMSLSAVMKGFLEDFVKVHASDEEKTVVLGPKARKRLRKSVEEAEKGIGVSPGFTSAKDFIAYLNEE